MAGREFKPTHGFLEEPWRKINWGNKQTDLKYVKDFMPPTECEKLRILLHGPVGAGKSSFINSVQSVLRGRMYAMALVANASGDSFTKKYSTYYIEKEEPGLFYPFVFSDIMGLEAKRGVLVNDIKMALKGHVKDDYRFNPESRLPENDQYYNSCPNRSDKVHVLVCVVPAKYDTSEKEEIVRQIHEIRREARDLRIPQLVLFTKVDQFCPEVAKDLKNVYKVKYVKDKMEELSAEVGVPMNCIFPVKNYSEENALNDDIDSLILNALTNIINFGEDFISHTMTMGRGQSRPTPEPTFLEEPWRNINWRNKQTDLKYVNDFMPPTECEKIRILLYGPVGAGKSSFINSVQSVLRGRMSAMALVANTSGDSFTKKYKTYKIRKDGQSFYPFVFSDTMGLEETKGVLVNDIKMALKGHMKDGYRFNPESRLPENDQYYNSCPDLSDQVHVLVCVVSATTATSMRDETVRKIREIREEASELGIPHMVLLTKVDQACPEVAKDLKNVYKVKSIKQEMEKFSAKVGVPMNCIFPVKNYSEELKLNDDVDSLILSALTNIINCGEDFISLTTS